MKVLKTKPEIKASKVHWNSFTVNEDTMREESLDKFFKLRILFQLERQRGRWKERGGSTYGIMNHWRALSPFFEENRRTTLPISPGFDSPGDVDGFRWDKDGVDRCQSQRSALRIAIKLKKTLLPRNIFVKSIFSLTSARNTLATLFPLILRFLFPVSRFFFLSIVYFLTVDGWH